MLKSMNKSVKNLSGFRKRYFFLLFSLLFIPADVYFVQESKALGAVYATVETAPTLHSGDSADDSTIWIHPTNPSLSTIIGTDKNGNLDVYDLSGVVLQRIPIKTNNVDLRYNFPLGGQRVALVTGVDRSANKLFAYKVNPATRLLEDVSTLSSLPGLLGSSMYVSPITDKYYAFTNRDSVLKQYELVDNGSGRVAVNLVRTVTFGSFVNLTEGVTADDVHAKVYVSEEAVAIWKLGAEPTDGSTKVMVDKPIAQGGHFQPDIEGLTIYYKTDGTGYLMGSSQGNNTFTVYTREGNNTYLGTFNIGDGVIDGVNGTDGIDVTNFPLGPNFPNGIFIAQDGSNTDGNVTKNQNFKLVPFESIAAALNLTMDTSWDPRLVGATTQPPVTISGSVGEAGVTLSYTDGTSNTVTSSENGDYALSVSYNWSGTVQPSHACFTFSPIGRNYTNITTNQTAQDYVATFNPASGCAEIDVEVGGNNVGHYGILPGTSLRDSYADVDGGPVKVFSMNNLNIVTALRDAISQNGVVQSWAQLMGLPETQLSTTYYFPAYNNVTLSDQLRFANLGNTQTTVTVKIGSVINQSYVLQAGESLRVSYPGVDAGPVTISSDGQLIIAALREAWSQNGIVESWVQMMGLPALQLSDTYYFPAYNNVTLSDQLRFANLGNAQTTVTVKIGNVVNQSYVLQAGESLRVSYPGVDAGPVTVSSNSQLIIAALREVWSQNGIVESWSQLMGLPSSQLSTTYYFPAYSNITLSDQLRFANLGNAQTTVTVKIGSVVNQSYVLQAGESLRVSYPGVDNGPVTVSSNSQLIIATLRDAKSQNEIVESWVQLMGLPASQLSETYYFPAYNNVTLSDQLRIAVP